MNIEMEIRELYDEQLKNIYSYVYDEGMDNELILNPGYLCLYIGKRLLKIEDVLYEGQIKIKISDEEDYHFDREIPYKIDISKFIINNCEYADWFVKRIGVIGNKEKNVYEALQIDLYSKQNMEQSIFIHSGFFGLESGQIEKKQDWMENSYIPLYGHKPIMFYF